MPKPAKIGVLQYERRPTSEDARRELMREQGRWLRQANADFGAGEALPAGLAMGAAAGPYVQKLGLMQALTTHGPKALSGPFLPIAYAQALIAHNAANYDLRRHNRLASQAFSRRNGMYNPNDN